MGRFDLTERRWGRVAPHLPPEKPATGRRPNDDHRRIVSGILSVLRAGAPWRDLPARRGPVGTVSNRFHRWRRAGVWDRALAALQAEADARGGGGLGPAPLVDAALVRAHQHATPPGRRRRGGEGRAGPV